MGMRRTNKHNGVAKLVLLVVDRALEEDLGSAGLKSVEDEAGAILRDHATRDGSVHEVEHLSRARMRVGGVHAARLQEPKRHRQPCRSMVRKHVR